MSKKGKNSKKKGAKKVSTSASTHPILPSSSSTLSVDNPQSHAVLAQLYGQLAQIHAQIHAQLIQIPVQSSTTVDNAPVFSTAAKTEAIHKLEAPSAVLYAPSRPIKPIQLAELNSTEPVLEHHHKEEPLPFQSPKSLHPAQYVLPEKSFSPRMQTYRRDLQANRTPSRINRDSYRVIPDNTEDVDPIEMRTIVNFGNIQGDVLAGFNKPMIGLKINGDIEEVKNWLKHVVKPKLSSTLDVMTNRDEFRDLRRIKGTKLGAISAMRQKDNGPGCFLNISFTYQGLKTLIGDDSGIKEFSDESFKHDYRGDASIHGDPTPQKDWKIGGIDPDSGTDSTIDILLQIGGDTQALVELFVQNTIGSVATYPKGKGLLLIQYQETGFRNPALPGQEHFGFLDGIGQPAFKGVYKDAEEKLAYISARTIINSKDRNTFSYPGIDLVWPGEFVFGYVTPDPSSPLDPYLIDKEPASAPYFGKFPAWAKDGTLLAFKRLQQDVPMFWNYIKEEASKKENFPDGITDDGLGALMVGRWPSGAPIMRTLHKDIPEMGDQALSNSNFQYGKGGTRYDLQQLGGKPDEYDVAPPDPHGNVCPYFGHIRKVQPRDNADENPLKHRIIRRGSPYGEFSRDRYQEDGVDRGLLFTSYQASVTNGLKFLQSTWANSLNLPKSGGHDPIIGQPEGERLFQFTYKLKSGQNKKVKLTTKKRWVIPTGGSYLFVPPVDFFNDGSPLFPK